MSKTIQKIKTIVEDVSIRGEKLPKGFIVDVLPPGAPSNGKDIHIGVAKYLIFNNRAVEVTETRTPAPIASDK